MCGQSQQIYTPCLDSRPSSPLHVIHYSGCMAWRVESCHSSCWHWSASLLCLSVSPQSCHDKLIELFSEKLHLIGLAALVIGIIMVSVRLKTRTYISHSSGVERLTTWPLPAFISCDKDAGIEIYWIKLLCPFSPFRFLRWSSPWCSAVGSVTALGYTRSPANKQQQFTSAYNYFIMCFYASAPFPFNDSTKQWISLLLF